MIMVASITTSTVVLLRLYQWCRLGLLVVLVLWAVAEKNCEPQRATMGFQLKICGFRAEALGLEHVAVDSRVLIFLLTSKNHYKSPLQKHHQLEGLDTGAPSKLVLMR